MTLKRGIQGLVLELSSIFDLNTYIDCTIYIFCGHLSFFCNFSHFDFGYFLAKSQQMYDLLFLHIHFFVLTMLTQVVWQYFCVFLLLV